MVRYCNSLHLGPLAAYTPFASSRRHQLPRGISDSFAVQFLDIFHIRVLDLFSYSPIFLLIEDPSTDREAKCKIR